MKNLVFLTLLWVVTATQGIYGQPKPVTDNDIVNALLGKSFYSLNKTLDSLGIWYYNNFHQNKSVSGQETKAKVYSIANGKGTVKVYMIHLHAEKKHITEVVINFRHDDRNQIEDLKGMAKASDYHVGTYSTDLSYKGKR